MMSSRGELFGAGGVLCVLCGCVVRGEVPFCAERGDEEMQAGGTCTRRERADLQKMKKSQLPWLGQIKLRGTDERATEKAENENLFSFHLHTLMFFSIISFPGQNPKNAGCWYNLSACLLCVSITIISTGRCVRAFSGAPSAAADGGGDSDGSDSDGPGSRRWQRLRRPDHWAGVVVGAPD
jgi:hypothetical protein